MAKMDGRLVALIIGSATLMGRTTGSLDMSADMLDTTTADSAGAKEYIGGEYGGTVQVGALYDPEAIEGFSESFGYLKAGTILTIKWGPTTPGSTYYTSSALISSVNLTGDKNSIASYTVNLQLTGAITESTVAGS